MGDKGNDQVIGYKYYLDIDFGWCHGPVDRLTRIWFDNKNVYEGSFESGTIGISKKELFGEFEGGIQGGVNLYPGNDTQVQDPELLQNSEWTTDNLPAYRGICHTVLWKNDDRGFYVGNNPYLKRVTAEFQRIYKRIRDGVEADQWQKSIAGVPLIQSADSNVSGVLGTLRPQSIFITVDLSSASNGYSGRNGSISGVGMDIEQIKDSVKSLLVDIRDNYQRSAAGGTGGDPLIESILSPFVGDLNNFIDIGVGFYRYSTGAQNNTSANPNNVDVYEAPVPAVTGGTYDLPKRGWMMKESATDSDFNDLLAFVETFDVVPDTATPDIGLAADNLTEAMATLAGDNDRPRTHIWFGGFVTSQSEASILTINDEITTALEGSYGYDSSYEPGRLIVGPPGTENSATDGTTTDGNDFAIVTFGTPAPDSSSIDNWDLGPWYLIAEDPTWGAPEYMLLEPGGGPFTVGDRTIIDIPSGFAANKPWGLPGSDDTQWVWGDLMRSGIYAGRVDGFVHYQRDSTGDYTITYPDPDGNQITFEDNWTSFEDPDVGAGPLDTTGWNGLYRNFNEGVYIEMNPAHIIRECLTDQQWGIGLAEAEIDETSFAAAAQTLYDERFGISLAWTQEEPIEDFINLILNHIDAVLFISRATGTWKLVLIRDDYDPNTLDEFTDAEVVDWVNIDIKGPAELVNSVTVKYNTRDDETGGGEAGVTVNNLAQIQKLGQVVHTTLNYPAIWQELLALRVAQRDLITLSTALIAGEVTLTRDAYELEPGDVFKLTSSRYNLSGEVMRVVEVDVGDGTNNVVRVKFTQDKFNLDTTTDTDVVGTPDNIWTDPALDPTKVVYREVQEEPYYLFALRVGELDAEEAETEEPDQGHIIASGVQPSSNAINARIRYDDGVGYVNNSQVMPFGPYAILDEELRERADETTLTLRSFTYYADVSVGDLFQLDDEIVAVSSIDSTTQLTVERGALDTVPAYHPKDTRLVYIQNRGTILEDFVASDSVDVKLLTNTGSGRLEEGLAPVDTVTLDSRTYRPYGVGQLQLGGAYSAVWDTSSGATLEATWVHKDRTVSLTPGNPPVHTDATVGPETNSDYTISAVAYDINGNELTSLGDLFSYDVNQDTSYTIPTDSYVPASGEVWSVVGVRVTNTRGTSPSYTNWQTPEVYGIIPADPADLSGFPDLVWVDANDISTLFQDDEGVTPVVYDGDPVGFMANIA